MYTRKIESVFQSWMDAPSHKPIVVKGVRQCGKTSSVVDFANKHFRHIVYLDFREHPDYKMFFTPNLNVDDIIMRITAAMPDVEIEAGNTCFIFDEIQDCPRARGSLKYFFLDDFFISCSYIYSHSEKSINKAHAVRTRLLAGFGD